ncbi:MAG TPA: hypothetical protein VFK05_28430 [Polyangiaceae bacterium]|nr:hypothetical protein [Polyangiaceae bacterium]
MPSLIQSAARCLPKIIEQPDRVALGARCMYPSPLPDRVSGLPSA